MPDYSWPSYYYYPAYDNQDYDTRLEFTDRVGARKEHLELVLATALPIIILLIFIG